MIENYIEIKFLGTKNEKQHKNENIPTIMDLDKYNKSVLQ